MIDKNLSSSAATAAGDPDLGVPVSDEDVDAIDGCDVEIVDETPDEELPPTEGGVA